MKTPCYCYICLSVLAVLSCNWVLAAAGQLLSNNAAGKENHSTAERQLVQTVCSRPVSETKDIFLKDEKCLFFERYADCLPVITITASKNNICSGTAITFHSTVTNEGVNVIYKWKRNNQDAGVSSAPDYTFDVFRNGDQVSCEYNCHTACGTEAIVQSNVVTINVMDDVTPTVTVSNADSLVCEGELTTFTASAFYGSCTPLYQWTVNGTEVGGNNPTFTTNAITNGSKVECLVTVSTPACPSFSRSASSQLTIYVYPLVHPAITIQPSATNICRGEQVTFQAKANGGVHPAFTWLVNDIQTGPNSPSLSTNSLKDGDKITCTVTIEQNSRCHESTTSAGSNEIVMHVRNYPEPAVIITSPDTDVCAGTPVYFTADAENFGNAPKYQWSVNGSKKGDESLSFMYDQFADGDRVYCLLSTDIPGCSTYRTVSSDTANVRIRAFPVIRFASSQVSIMSGEAAHLETYVSDSLFSYAWVPADVLADAQSLSPTTRPLFHDTLMRVDVVNIYGCKASANILIKVLRPLYMPSAFTPNGDGKNDVFRIPLGSAIELYKFSIFDRWGNVVFTTADAAKGWNGIYKGNVANAGTYIYLIKGKVMERETTLKGTLTLVR